MTVVLVEGNGVVGSLGGVIYGVDRQRHSDSFCVTVDIGHGVAEAVAAVIVAVGGIGEGTVPVEADRAVARIIIQTIGCRRRKVVVGADISVELRVFISGKPISLSIIQGIDCQVDSHGFSVAINVCNVVGETVTAVVVRIRGVGK